MPVTVAVSLMAVAAAAPAAQAAPGLILVTSQSSNKVSVLKLDGAGALSPVSGSPFGTGTQPVGVAVAPDARHAYVANQDGTVSAYSVGAGGALAPVSGSPFALPGGSADAFGVAVAPDGKRLFVTDFGQPRIVSFSIGAGGELTSPHFAALAGNPEGLAMTPDGKHVYAAITDGTTAAFTVNGDGTLTAVSGQPFASGDFSTAAAVTPDGTHLLVSNDSSLGVAVFSIGANGALSAVAGSPFSAGSGARGLAVAPNGKNAYAAAQTDGKVVAYSIAASGALAPVSGSPFGAGTNPVGVALTPDGHNAYASNNTNVSGYSVGAAGGLVPVPGTPFPTGGSGAFVASIAAVPDQGPVAAIKADPDLGLGIKLDGGVSTDSDGHIVRYDWDYGDGVKAPGGQAKFSHTYPKLGVYTVKLTVTDDSGCSTARIFTGQTVGCNGGPAAHFERLVDVFPGVVFKNQSAKVKKGKARVKLTCPKGSIGPSCKGTLTLTYKKKAKKGKPAKTVTVGKATLTLKPGTPAKAKVKLTKRGRKLVAAHATLKTTGTAIVTDGGGTTKTKLAKVKLKR